VGWKTAYAAFRMAVETAKESSDMCPPLKAVVGAVFVLMKNCDVSAPRLRTENILIFVHFLLQQTSDNLDKIKEIERRAHSLSGVLASPASEDDYEEKERRVVLQGFVLVWVYVNLLIFLIGSSRELLQNLNLSVTNTSSLGSYTMLIMPRP